MGLHDFLMERLSHVSKQVPHIERAYFHQSVALVTICRQIVPHVGFDSERKGKLERAIESLNKALECARNSGHQEKTDEALKTATDLVVKYLRKYHLKDKVMGDINKLLIDSETAVATEFVSDTVEDQVAVAEKRLDEKRRKDQDAGQQIQRLSQRLNSKLKSLSTRTKRVEVWVWPAELNLDERGVRRPEVVLEDNATLDHVLCRVLDFVPIDKLTLSLNPQFYKHLIRDEPFPSRIEALQSSDTLSNFQTKTTLVLHLVVDRQWRVVIDAVDQVQVFGNVIKVRDDVVFLKNKLGALVSARELLEKKEPVSLYSNPHEITMQLDDEWFSVIIKAAEMYEPCDFLVSQRPSKESTLKPLPWKPFLDGNPINKSPHQPPSKESKTLGGNPINRLPPNESTSNTLHGNSINKSLHTKDVSIKEGGQPKGRLQNVSQGVSFIGSDVAPIPQNFQQERVQPKKGWFKRIFG